VLAALNSALHDLSELSACVIAVHGDADPAVPWTEALARAVPRTHPILVPGFGHIGGGDPTCGQAPAHGGGLGIARLARWKGPVRVNRDAGKKVPPLTHELSLNQEGRFKSSAVSVIIMLAGVTLFGLAPEKWRVPDEARGTP
jgi:hypothetical protein